MSLARVLTGLTLLAAPFGLAGQSELLVRVVDDLTGGPVTGARVTVLLEEEVVAGPFLTSSEGTVRVSLRQEGSVHLRVEQLGYPPHRSVELEVRAFEQFEIEVRLTPEPIELAPLEVVARGFERGRDAFERRRALGEGVFFDPIEVALMRDERHIVRARDFVRNVPGLLVTHRELRSFRGWGCVTTFVDHAPYAIGYSGSGNGPRLALGGEAEFLLADPRNIRAIEVYRSIDEIPEELRRGRNWGSIGRCGVIWYWTYMAW